MNKVKCPNCNSDRLYLIEKKQIDLYEEYFIYCCKDCDIKYTKAVNINNKVKGYLDE